MDIIKAVEIIRGLLVPFIAIMAVYIAYQQHKTNKSRLKLELYDKRFEIYDTTKKFISHIVRKAQIELIISVQFLKDTAESEFLFNDDVNDFIEKLYRNALELEKIQLSLEFEPVGAKRSQMVERQLELLTWYSSQFNTAKVIYSKYLNFRDLA